MESVLTGGFRDDAPYGRLAGALEVCVKKKKPSSQKWMTLGLVPRSALLEPAVPEAWLILLGSDP